MLPVTHRHFPGRFVVIGDISHHTMNIINQIDNTALSRACDLHRSRQAGDGVAPLRGSSGCKMEENGLHPVVRQHLQSIPSGVHDRRGR